MNQVKNPKLFREMSEPHESREALNENIGKFFNGVQELRKAHKIQNIVVVVGCSYLNGEDEQQGYAIQIIGDQSAAESMCAYGYGCMKTEREDFMSGLLRGKKRGGSE